MDVAGRIVSWTRWLQEFASSESLSCRVVVISNSRRQDSYKSYNVESDNDAVDRRRSHLVIVRLEVV